MKRFLRNLPIRHKLMAITMAISCAALLLACAAFAINEQAAFRRTMARDFAILADMFDDNVAAGLAFKDVASIEQTLRTLGANQRIVAACVYDKDGVVVATYHRTETDPAAFEFPGAQATLQRWSAERLDTFQDITLAGESIGVVYIGTDLSELRERAWRYAAIVSILLAASSLVAFVLVSRLQRIVSQPIVDLAHTVAAVAAQKNYGVRAHKESDDELGRLIDGFNEMLAQIQARDGALQSAHDGLEQRVVERTADLKLENAERRLAEEQLRAKTAILEAQMDASIDGILVVDGAGKKIFQNRRTVDLWRMPPEIAGEDSDEKQIQFVVGRTKHPEAFVAKVRHLYAHPTESSRDEIELKDGTTLDRYSAPVIGKEGTNYGRIWAFRDITERKRAEAALRQEQELLAAILENVADGILACDAEGKLTLSNGTLREFHGLPLEPVPAERWAEYFEIRHPDGNTPMTFDQTPLYRALQGEQVRDVELVITPKNRPARKILVSGQAFYAANGAKTGAVVIVHDITARKLAETRLAETHRQLLDISRRAGMAEIATGVLHNVGNVLNSVNVSATLVLDRVRNTKSAGIAKLSALLAQHNADLGGFLVNDPRGRMVPGYLSSLAESLATEQQVTLTELEHLRKNIEHIKEIVAMQQTYARKAGISEIISVPDVVDEALRMNADSLAQHNIGVVLDHRGCPAIATEKHKVMQILINLIRNANHACDESTSKEKRVVIRTWADEHTVRIAVIDNGVGIPAENLTRIFSHGFTTRQHGHGFGLHSGALAAKELGGAIVVQSDGPDRGATFTLELPLAPPDPAAGNTPP